MNSTAEPMINLDKFYTYAYLREDRTPYYIGKGQGKRIYSTSRKVKPPKDKSRIIFLKQNLTEEEAFKHEIYMIAVLGRKDLGTGILRNRTDGGEGHSGAIRSDETRRKISAANKGKILSEETKRKIGDANKGKTASEESRKKNSEAHKNPSEKTRKKMSEGHKGKTHSEETKKKMSEAHKNPSKETRKKLSDAHKNPSKETRKKLSDANKGAKNPNYGKTVSEETRKRMSNACKGKKWWNDGRGNCKLKVDCPGDDWKLGRK